MDVHFEKQSGTCNSWHQLRHSRKFIPHGRPSKSEITKTRSLVMRHVDTRNRKNPKILNFCILRVIVQRLKLQKIDFVRLSGNRGVGNTCTCRPQCLLLLCRATRLPGPSIKGCVHIFVKQRITLCLNVSISEKNPDGICT